ncbi:conserved hypothetical protein [Talaromyces stipitatus ATCC 10500]|uniref:Uncharacterized protein n=1 Tax=Talaromyces stipitatus (strain ATCC 10500 / CBS 375.48 / QM 6759 / NRRL 1006) TaxID=441959 RepID=B8M4P7_TALSN|nr:uncharacterized protein TSTA_025590 [Talaromyces stipitatus ATCC 10500]EED19242.1 conserved hypothetical protein [Talaromyces stipitatus ATCC 10500]
MASSTRPQLSKLESLPPELLEKIFFHSLSINLPRSSLHIAHVLSKPIIYKWLIRLAFSSANPGSRQGIFTEDFLPSPLDFWALSNAERSKLQGVILECRWSTLRLFRECQRDYVLHVLRQKGKGIVFVSEEDRKGFNSIEEKFTRSMMEFDKAEHGRRGSGDLILKGKFLDSSEGNEEKKGGDIRLSIWFHFGAVQIREPSPVAHEIDMFRLPCPPSPNERPRMPDKLLHAPWTDEKIEFLTLLSQETYVDEHNQSSERSLQVLRQLIRDRDYVTFERLLNLKITTKDYSYPQKWPVKTRHFREAVRLRQGRNDPFVGLLFDKRWDSLKDRTVREMVLKSLEND